MGLWNTGFCILSSDFQLNEEHFRFTRMAGDTRDRCHVLQYEVSNETPPSESPGLRQQHQRWEIVVAMFSEMCYHTPRTGVIKRANGCPGYTLLFPQQPLLVRVNGVEQECQAGSLIIWSPGEAQFYGRPRTTWEHTGFVYRGAGMGELLESLGIPCNRLLICADPSVFDDFLRFLEREYRQPNPDEQLLRSLLQSCVLLLRRLLLQTAVAQPAPTILQEMNIYLNEHYTEPISLGELAARYGLSLAYFSKVFKTEFGVSPIKYITRLRMEASRRLLRRSMVTIAEVAQQVGYANAFYFNRMFRAYYGETPGALRSRANQLNTGPRSALNHSPHHGEGWQVVANQDFRSGDNLDPRWQFNEYDEGYQQNALPATPEQLLLQEGRLHLLPSPSWLQLRWSDDVAEECLVDLVLQNTTPSTGVNFAISLSGDLTHGYRLRLYGDMLQLETVFQGQWKVLAYCAQRLDLQAPSYRVVYWRVHDEFFVEINGERLLSYYDPGAPTGVRHRTVALGRFGHAGSATISSLCVRARPHALTHDVLEPGRVLFRKGYFAEAHQWFQDTLCEQTEAAIRQEADYYAVLSLDAYSPARESALLRIASEETHLYRTRALRVLALWYLTQRKFSSAVETILRSASLTATDDLSSEIAIRLVDELRYTPLTDQQEILSLLARLPITRLHISNTALTTLAPLARMPLRELSCCEIGLTDLSLLHEMPLVFFDCSNNQISNLAPLTGLPLQDLFCSNNQIADIAPLVGLPLRRINCAANHITDLTPLHGMALQELNCGENHIAELSALASMPLSTLHCENNVITDLSPLRGMPLSWLNCAHNRIRDLSPIQGMLLTYLDISDNPSTDLTPLTGMPLTKLYMHEHPMSPQNVGVLASLPLRHLWCTPTDEVMEITHWLEMLQSLNGHQFDHAKAVWPMLTRLFSSFQRGDPTADAELSRQLRAKAQRCGDRDYLSLPCQLSTADAMAFAHWLGARLPCPVTTERFAQLRQYLASVTIHLEYIAIYLGLQLNANGQHYWHDGTPYTCDVTPEIPMLVPEASCAVFLVTAGGSPHLSISQGQMHRSYVTIEYL